MCFEEACRIMSVSGTESQQELKKRYRQLMHQVHPDVLCGRKPAFGYAAWEINAAYEILMNRDANAARPKPDGEGKSGHGRRWPAPLNERAFIERNIYSDNICLATGKYYYTEEEGLPMFLHSIYRCSMKVLQGFSDSLIQKYLSETAYLLSQQFVNREMILERYVADIQEKGKVYYFPAMLETEGKRCALSAGTVLVPGKLRCHRLYLNSISGKEEGYISFYDDLIYYALIPLFEQRKVLIKTCVSGSVAGNNNKRAIRVRTLDLWVLLIPGNWKEIEVCLSDQIEAVIRKCRMEENDHE